MSINVEQIVGDLTNFLVYVESFYGNVPDAVYPIGATPEMILEATAECWKKFGIENFCADSVDRERVRDIMIEKFGLEWK